MALTYEVVTRTRAGKERAHRYVSEAALGVGDVVRLDGRDWLVQAVEPADRIVATAARYRLRLRHPDGREELGAFRRYRPGAPRLGHAFSTLVHGRPVSWRVVDERVTREEEGEPYLDLVAERDFAELEELPDHELEHSLASQDGPPAGAAAAVARAEEAGLAVELVALEAGEAPDWDAAAHYIESLVVEMVEDDLLVLCGVDTNRDPPETWIETVKARLRSDLVLFRADIEGDHTQIEEWEFLDGRVFAAVGSIDDEADPDSGHGWMCRLLDASPLVTAGFARVRKAELL